MKLRAVLSQHAPPELRQIADSANLTIEPRSNKTALIDLLCRNLPAPESVQARLSSLPQEQRDLVFALAAEGGELLEEEAVDELCDGFANRFQAQLEALTRAGLVFRDCAVESCALIGIPDALLKSIELSPPQQGRLRSLMKPMSVGLLRAFARQLNLSFSDARRPLIIQTIRQALVSPDKLKTYLQGLSDEKRAILDLLLNQKATTRADVFETLGEGIERDLDELLWKTPFFYTLDSDNAAPETPIFLASDLRLVLRDIAKDRGGQLESQLDDVLQHAADPGSVYDNTPTLMQDLATLLGLIERKWPKRLKRGGIPKSDLRDASRFCHGQADPGYVEFLSLFVETAGLVRPDGAIWRTAPDGGARLEGAADVRKSLFAFWRQTDRWNEWAADRTTGAARSARMNGLKKVRQEIIKALQKCTPDTWITYASFYRFLARLSEPFRHYADTPSSGRTLAAGGTTADELLRRMFGAALSWMGVVRLGNPDAFLHPLQNNDQAVFQLSQAGFTLLHGKTGPELLEGLPPQNPEAKFVVQPNCEVLAPPDLLYPHFVSLCGLTDLKSQDVMTCFSITREAIKGALNRGMSGQDMRTFLTTHSATGLPDIVETLISECENKYGEIEMAPASGFLSVADEGLLDELYAQKRISESLGKRLSPTTAALAPHTRIETLEEILHQQGYMPRVLYEPHNRGQDRHQIIFTSSEIGELVGFLETASDTLSEKTEVGLEDLSHLTKRLKRALRRTPDETRSQAADRYRQAFDQAVSARQAPEEGLEDLLRYTGPNPATQPAEVHALINYAIDHQLCAEIAYGASEDAPRRIIEPFSQDHAMLYAFCQARKGDRVFRLDKIPFARLTGEPFHRKN